MKKYISFIIMIILVVLLCGSSYAQQSQDNTTHLEKTPISQKSSNTQDTNTYNLKNEFEKAKQSSNTTYNIKLDQNKTYSWTEEFKWNNSSQTRNIVVDGSGSTINIINSSFISIGENYGLSLNNLTLNNTISKDYRKIVYDPIEGNQSVGIDYLIANNGGTLNLTDVVIDNTQAYYTMDTYYSNEALTNIKNTKVFENNEYTDNSVIPAVDVVKSSLNINNLTTTGMIDFYIQNSTIVLNNSNLNWTIKHTSRTIFDSNILATNTILRNFRVDKIDNTKINMDNTTLDGYFMDSTNSNIQITNSRLMFANPLYSSAINLANSTLKATNDNILYNTVDKAVIFALNSTVNVDNSYIANNRATTSIINSLNSTLNVKNTTFTNNTVNAGAFIYASLTNSNITSNIIVHNNNKEYYDLYYVKSRLNASSNVFRNNTENVAVKAMNNTYNNVNYNWWSTNNPNISKLVEGTKIVNWRILTFLNTTSLNNNTVKTETGLYMLNTGKNYTATLPMVTAEYGADSGNFTHKSLNFTNKATNTYTGSLKNFYVKVDNQAMRISHKIEPTITLVNSTVRTNDRVVLKVTVNSDATGSITFTGYGANTTQQLVNSSTTFNITARLSGGDYIFTVKYNGNSKYQSKEVRYKITVQNNQNITPTDKYRINETTIDIPSKYDLRDYNQVTPIKTQSNSGNCWAFASIATVESAIAKQTNLTYDLSENNMKNVIAKYSPIGYIESNSAASIFESIGYLSSWTGPVLESMDTYNRDDYEQVGNIYSSPILKPSFKIQDIYMIPNRKNITDNNLIKEAIMKYGAVYTTIYVEEEYTNDSYIYNTGLTDGNHAVAIIGWDDSIDKNNFKTIFDGQEYTPHINGAFIIKNSWGSQLGDNGYFYVSYDDPVIAGINSPYICNYAVIYNKTPQYDNIYQYDYINKQVVHTDYKKLFLQNRFTAKSDEIIAAISTTVIGNKYNYTAYIYVNDTLKFTQSGQINTPGYRTIPLNTYVQVNKNETFAVILKITSTQGLTIAVNSTNDPNNNSYFSTDGQTWSHNLEANWGYTSIDTVEAAPLKVFTINNPHVLTKTAVKNNKLVVTTTADVNGNITYTLMNQTIKTNSTTPAEFNITRDMNNTQLITSYTNELLNIKSNKTVTLQPRVEVMASKQTVKMGETLTLTAKKLDTNDTSVAIFKLNGVTIKDANGNPLKAKFINGTASINYTIPDGWRAKTLNLTVVTSIDGKRQEESTTFDIVKIQIKFNNTNTTRVNNTLTITSKLLDGHDHNVLGQNVVAVKINGVTYKQNNKNHYFITENAILSAVVKIPNSLLNKEFTIELVTGDRYSYLGTRQTINVTL